MNHKREQLGLGKVKFWISAGDVLKQQRGGADVTVSETRKHPNCLSFA